MGSISKQISAAATDSHKRSIDLLQVHDSSASPPSVRNVELAVESNNFPSDVVIGILSRLPAKTLLRFKSACKNWDAMIPRNPYLVSMHLKNYTNNPATKPSLLCNYYESDSRTEGSSEFRPRSVSICLDGKIPVNVDESLLRTVICGTGSGLFLLRNPSCPYSEYRLWNPATGEIRVPPPRPIVCCSDCIVGVGVDLVANDIKVVLIQNCIYLHGAVPCYTYLHSSRVFVYTLRSNCWSELAVRYQHPEDGERESIRNKFHCPTYFKGFLYWIFRGSNRIFSGANSNKSYVVAFDMGTNCFHNINYPLDAPRDCKLSIYRDSIVLLEKSLCCLSVKGKLNSFTIDVWLLSNRDGKWCWIKHSILGSASTTLFFKGFWKDNRLVVEMPHERQLVLFDTCSGQGEVLVPNCFEVSDWHIYNESLASIEGQIQV